MNFDVKSVEPGKDILLTMDDYSAITVSVSATGVVAGSDGRKIVKAGTIIGGVLADPKNSQAVAADGAEVAAEGILYHDVDVTSGDSVGTMIVRGIVDTAKLPAAPTEAQKAQLKQIVFFGGEASDSVAGIDFLLSKGDYTTVPIKVSATGVEANAAGKKIVSAGTVLGAALANDNGAVAASTAATDNSNNPTPAEGILLYDVDVTDGKADGVLLVRGVVDASELGAAVNAYQRGTLPGIVFVGTYS